MSTEAQLQKQALKIREQLHSIETSKWRKRSKPLIGRCYRYLNSYGNDGNWWLYSKIIAMGEYRTLTAFRFQKKSDGAIEIELNHPIYNEVSSGNVEIREEEFQHAWKELLKELNDATP